MCGPGQDSNILFGPVSHLGWTQPIYTNKAFPISLRQKRATSSQGCSAGKSVGTFHCEKILGTVEKC